MISCTGSLVDCNHTEQLEAQVRCQKVVCLHTYACANLSETICLSSILVGWGKGGGGVNYTLWAPHLSHGLSTTSEPSAQHNQIKKKISRKASKVCPHKVPTTLQRCWQAWPQKQNRQGQGFATCLQWQNIPNIPSPRDHASTL